MLAPRTRSTKLMSKLAAEGKSIIMISSEMTEILRMSDRIIIMCEGKVTGDIDISKQPRSALWIRLHGISIKEESHD